MFLYLKKAECHVRLPLPAKCEGLVAQLKMAVETLTPCWYHKVDRIKKEQNFIRGKKALESKGVFVLEFLGS